MQSIGLREKGEIYVRDFSSYVQRSFRNRLMYSAIQYKARKLSNASLSLDYEENSEGCRLICNISDNSKSLVEMKLLTQNRTQAELIGERISDNPSSFYKEFIDYIIQKRNPHNMEIE